MAPSLSPPGLPADRRHRPRPPPTGKLTHAPQVEFGDIHEQNLEQLKKLNLAIFPVRYNQKFYKNMLNTPKEFTQVC